MSLTTPLITDQFDYRLPAQRSPCFAHTLQLTVGDGMKAAGGMHSVIAKVGKLVSYCKRSTAATDV